MRKLNTATAESKGGQTKIAKHGLTPATAEIEAQLERILGRVPPLIVLPKPKERCPYSSRSRTGLLELIAPCQRNNFKPPVRAIYKRAHKHAQRGQWLIPSENLFRFLFGLAETSADEYLETTKARAAARQEGKA